MTDHITPVRAWFESRGITDAVVGWSGGVDSATTAALLRRAGITVTLVVAEAPGQRYSSPYGGGDGAARFAGDFGLALVEYDFNYPDFLTSVGKEAALPILRNACFYGIAAQRRAHGHKAVVAGTANFSEAAFLGFWGKASDGAQDVYPISHLSKIEVYELARQLEVPQAIIDAVPSGDLLFQQTNDREMIGATYNQIEDFIYVVETIPEQSRLVQHRMLKVDDPKKFADNIIRNSFKYELPFPGFHISNRLENFRTRAYPSVLKAAKCIM